MADDRLPLTLYHFTPRGSTRPDFTFQKPKMTIIEPDNFKFTPPKPKDNRSPRLKLLQKHVPSARIDSPSNEIPKVRRKKPHVEVQTTLIGDRKRVNCDVGDIKPFDVQTTPVDILFDILYKTNSKTKTKRRTCQKKQWSGSQYLSTF